MDWNLFIACLAVAAFGGAVAGYITAHSEMKSDVDDVHSGSDDVERRARRFQ